MQALGEPASRDHVSRKRAHLAARPAGEAPDHQLADARFWKTTVRVRSVDSARDVGAGAGIGQGVITCIAPKRLEGGGLHSPVLDEGVEKVLSHVAAPERAVAVGGDHAPRVDPRDGLDARPHVIGGLQSHGASIVDRKGLRFD